MTRTPPASHGQKSEELFVLGPAKADRGGADHRVSQRFQKKRTLSGAAIRVPGPSLSAVAPMDTTARAVRATSEAFQKANKGGGRAFCWAERLNLPETAVQLTPVLRVCATALVIGAFSFAFGVAGDLSSPPPAHGASVVVRIPPELPADTPRAHALSPLPHTATAQAQSRAVRHAQPAAPEVDEAAPQLSEPLLTMLRDHEMGHSAPASLAMAQKDEPDKLA